MNTTALRKRLGTLILGTAIATGGLVAAATPSASAAAVQPVNTFLSSTGAYLQASGLCGGSSTGFDVVSQGFEYLQLGVVTASGTTRIRPLLVKWSQLAAPTTTGIPSAMPTFVNSV